MRSRIGIIICSILVLCVFAGCKRPSEDGPGPTATPELSITQDVKPTGTTQAPLTVAPTDSTELPIYTLSGDFSELAAVTAMVDAQQEITEALVVDAVVDALADNAIYVRVNSVSNTDDVVTVDFDATSPPVSQVGAGIEGLILDAFAQSLLDNVSSCKAICFSVDGGDYASGHFEFSKEDVYLRR